MASGDPIAGIVAADHIGSAAASHLLERDAEGDAIIIALAIAEIAALEEVELEAGCHLRTVDNIIAARIPEGANIVAVGGAKGIGVVARIGGHVGAVQIL